MNKSSISIIKIIPLIFIISLIYIFYSLFSYLLPESYFPDFMGIPRMLPDFADIRQLTYTSECKYEYVDLINNIANCDPWGRNFNYPKPILDIFRFLKINSSQSILIGAILGGSFVITSSFYVFNRISDINNKYLLCILFLLSYPTQLILERGNYDQIIFLFLIFVPYLSIKKFSNLYLDLLRVFLLFVLTFFSINLKLFPFLGIVPWFCFLIYFKKSNNLVSYLIIFSSSFAFFSQFKYLEQILLNTPKPSGTLGFGLTASYLSQLGFSGSLFLTFFKIIIISISIFVFYKKRLIEELFEKNTSFLEIKKINFYTAIFFSFLIVPIYFLSSSWDYRLIFAFGIYPFFFNELKIKEINNNKFILSIIFPGIFILYEQYFNNFQNLLTVKGDVLIHIFSDVFVMPYLIGFLIYFLIYSISNNQYKELNY